MNFKYTLKVEPTGLSDGFEGMIEERRDQCESQDSGFSTEGIAVGKIERNV